MFWVIKYFNKETLYANCTFLCGNIDILYSFEHKIILHVGKYFQHSWKCWTNIPFSQQNCRVNSNFRVTEENLVFETVQSGPYSSFKGTNFYIIFNLRTTGISYPYASMCMDNPHMLKNINALPHKMVREISELFRNRIMGTRRDGCGDRRYLKFLRAYFLQKTLYEVT